MFRMQRKSANKLSILHYSQPIRFFAGPSTSKRSYYEILGLSSKATQAEIKEAFFALSKKLHPDLNPNNKDAHERFVEINEAYNVLSKPESRHAYDAKLQSPRPFSDRPDTSGQHQWSPKPGDPVDEMYRRYFEELYRRRYRTGSSQDQSFQGQRQESPFRDRWRDPPIWDDFFSERRQSRQDSRSDIRSRMSRENQLAYNIFRWYIIIVFTLLAIQTLFELLGVEPSIYPPPGHDPPMPDPRFEQQWRTKVAQDIAHHDRTSSSSTSDHAESKPKPSSSP